MGRGDLVWTIDGRPFDAARTDIDVAPDAVEEWEIRNPTSMDHPLSTPCVALPAGRCSWRRGVDGHGQRAGRRRVRLVVLFTRIGGRVV